MWLPSLLYFVALAVALDCAAHELDSYNFAHLQGTHDLEEIKETPPSTTRTTWYFGICEPVNTKKAPKCPKDVEICGVTEVKLDKNYMVTQVVGFDADITKKYIPFDTKKDKGVSVLYEEFTWGDELVSAEIRYVCDKEGDDKFIIEQWDGIKLKAHTRTKAACFTARKDQKKPKKPTDETGESWGWFTWIFIFMVLFLSIYIIGGAWFQYNKGNAIDFQSALREVLENFVDLLRGLPMFIREVIEKVTGSNRGEYSAV